jgi:elongation factor G
MFLTEQPISPEILQASIRRIVIHPKTFGLAVPVFMGAAFRNLGVQPLLDGVIAYLPSPSERPPVVSITNEEIMRRPSRKEPLTSYVFKMLFDVEHGPLAFTRVYAGRMGNVDIYNSTKKIPQKSNRWVMQL